MNRCGADHCVETKGRKVWSGLIVKTRVGLLKTPSLRLCAVAGIFFSITKLLRNLKFSFPAGEDIIIINEQAIKLVKLLLVTIRPPPKNKAIAISRLLSLN